MTYQRVLVKDSARRAIKGKSPCRRAFAFLLLCLLFSLLSMLPALIAGFVYLPAHAAPEGDAFFTMAALPPAFWLCQGLTLLLAPILGALLCAGWCAYCLDLWRGRGTDGGRFWAGFSQFSGVAALGLMIALFSLLWTLVGLSGIICVLWLLSQFGPVDLLPLLTAPAVPPEALAYVVIVLFILWALFAAFLLNRTLRYSLAFFVLLDHPRFTARQCLNESKALTQGRKWKLVVLMLSFIGWVLLAQLALLVAQLLWPILLSFYPISALPGFAFGCLRLMLILYLIALVVASFLLPLWLMNYVGVSFAGFYDFAQSDRQNRPTPPRSWQVYN